MVDNIFTIGKRAITFGGDERVRHEAGHVEGVVEAARRKVSKFVVVVGENLDDTLGAVSRLVPLGDRCSSKLTTLFFDDEDALADKELEGGVVADILCPLP